MNFLKKIQEIKIKNSERNKVRRILNKVEKMCFNRNIRDNPLLRRMRKEDWIVNVNNKHALRWASKYTIDILRAGMLGEEPIDWRKLKKEGKK